MAHSKLRSSVPANNSTVAGNFGEARLDFLEPIEAALSYFTLVGTDEAKLLRVEGADACEPKTCKFAVESLKAGTYRIDYHVLSADGHVVEGKIHFRVKADQ
ncbi:MAG: copper resistance protein CopC [Hyphomicrobiales bacterium]